MLFKIRFLFFFLIYIFLLFTRWDTKKKKKQNGSIREWKKTHGRPAKGSSSVQNCACHFGPSSRRGGSMSYLSSVHCRRKQEAERQSKQFDQGWSSESHSIGFHGMGVVWIGFFFGFRFDFRFGFCGFYSFNWFLVVVVVVVVEGVVVVVFSTHTA